MSSVSDFTHNFTFTDTLINIWVASYTLKLFKLHSPSIFAIPEELLFLMSPSV